MSEEDTLEAIEGDEAVENELPPVEDLIKTVCC